MNNQLTGVLREIYGVQQKTDKFKMQEFVVTDNTNAQYPQYITFQATQDRCNLLDGLNVGDTVEVSYNLRGKQYTNKAGNQAYFNSLEAWKITKVTTSTPQPQTPPANIGAANEPDDLEF